ncbi:hypothetical protein LINPERPRIM_LOCUS20118, partial [Linum perenne]
LDFESARNLISFGIFRHLRAYLSHPWLQFEACTTLNRFPFLLRRWFRRSLRRYTPGSAESIQRHQSIYYYLTKLSPLFNYDFEQVLWSLGRHRRRAWRLERLQLFEEEDGKNYHLVTQNSYGDSSVPTSFSFDILTLKVFPCDSLILNCQFVTDLAQLTFQLVQFGPEVTKAR